MKVSRTEAISGRSLLIVVSIVTIIPFLSLFTAGLSPSGTTPVGLSWPSDPQWSNFVTAFNVANIAPLLVSSTIIVLGVLPLTLLFGALGGYAFGLMRVPLANPIFFALILGLTIPMEALITPLYLQMQDWGLLGNRLAIIVPLIGLNMPFAVFWMRAHFSSMPRELSEAAVVDGASEWQVFWKVHIPLARGALSALGILVFLNAWNQFILAIVMVDDPLKRTMAGSLSYFATQYAVDKALLSAGALLLIAPVMIVFLLFQRQFSKALLEGAAKG
jgi:raffinose/stachyose/melibiose transport system permease protein